MHKFEDCVAFNPLRWTQHGNDYQRCQYRYNGTVITEDTVFYYNFLKPSRTRYTVDVLLADKQSIIDAGGKAVDSDTCYAEPGSWFAEFDDTNKLVIFIDNILPNLKTILL